MSLTLNQVGKNVVNNAIRLLKDSEITVAQFATATGISESTVRRIEDYKIYGDSKYYRPHLSTIVKLANAAQVEVGDFITGKLQVQ